MVSGVDKEMCYSQRALSKNFEKYHFKLQTTLGWEEQHAYELGGILWCKPIGKDPDAERLRAGRGRDDRG